jgi:Ser/Thr protein kinase RdoA (MazF antagonist)
MGDFNETKEISDEELRKLTKPNPSNEELLTLIKESFSEDPSTAKVEIRKQLDSYDDRNFLITLDGVKYLLKIHNGVESADYIRANRQSSSKLDLSNTMYRHLSQNGITTNQIVKVVRDSDTNKPLTIPVSYKDCPETYQVKAGDEVALHSLPVLSPDHSPRILAAQLLTWIEGSPMSDVPSLPIETLAEAGVFLGKLDHILDGMGGSNGEGLPAAAKRYHAWDGKNFADVRNFTNCIDDPKKRSMVESIITAFEREILPDASQFRKGLIHGDFNDANILLTGKSDLEVSGVIDFGDSIER